MNLRRVFSALALAMAALVPSAASAQVAPVRMFVLTDTNAHTIAAVPAASSIELIGFKSLSTTAQTATVTCWDSLTASGTVVDVEQALTTTNPVILPLGGLGIYTALTCQASAAPTGSGIAVYYRL